MGIVPEKNDVDISRLFTWGKEDTIIDDKGEVIMNYFIRLIGDADINQSRVHALRKSAEMRRKLRDPESDERLAYLPEEVGVTKESLIQAMLTIRGREISEKVVKEVELPFPVELDSEASLEDQEKYQKEVDSYEDRVKAEVESRVKKLLESEEKSYDKYSKKELYDNYISYFTNDICEKVMFEDFKNSCVYYGTFKDVACKERMFMAPEEVGSLPTEIKAQFVDSYSSLELTSDFLKKLPGATQS